MTTKKQERPPFPSSEPVELVGVEVMPLQDYLVALDGSAQSAQDALGEGAYRPDAVRLPPPRMRPILRKPDGLLTAPRPRPSPELEVLGAQHPFPKLEGGLAPLEPVSPHDVGQLRRPVPFARRNAWIE